MQLLDYFITIGTIAIKIIRKPAHLPIDYTWIQAPPKTYPAGFIVHATTAMVGHIQRIASYIHQWNIIRKIATEGIHQLGIAHFASAMRTRGSSAEYSRSTTRLIMMNMKTTTSR